VKAAAALIDFQSEETVLELGVFVQILIVTSRVKNVQTDHSLYAARRAVSMRALKSRIREGLLVEQTQSAKESEEK
jgi:hypothetical protein